MIAPLRTLMVSLWTMCVAGAFLVGSLTLGYDRPVDFVLCGIFGLAVGIPAGLMTARHLRREYA
jgi:hypothetical protein